jgi:hypothetical protein
MAKIPSLRATEDSGHCGAVRKSKRRSYEGSRHSVVRTEVRRISAGLVVVIGGRWCLRVGMVRQNVLHTEPLLPTACRLLVQHSWSGALRGHAAEGPRLRAYQVACCSPALNPQYFNFRPVILFVLDTPPAVRPSRTLKPGTGHT